MSKFNWTEKRVSTLGTTTDAKLAKRWKGVSKATIQRKRTALGIPAYNAQIHPLAHHVDGVWTMQALKSLGNIPDYKVGEMIDRSRRTVARKRTELDIPSFATTMEQQNNTPLSELPVSEWPKTAINLLGTQPDTTLAKILGTNNSRIQRARKHHGIGTFNQEMRKVIRPFAGLEADEVVAERFNVNESFVASVRQDLGVPNLFVDVWTPENVALLGTDTDRAISEKLSVPLHKVMAKRQSSNIDSYNKSAKRKVWTPEMDNVVLQLPVSQAAIQLDMTVTTVNRRRKALCKNHDFFEQIAWTEDMDKLLGTAPDINIAYDLQISSQSVSTRRRSLGVKSYKHSTKRISLTDKQMAVVKDLSLSTYKVSVKIGISHMTVYNIRKKHNLV
jgi:hypothetical protein